MVQLQHVVAGYEDKARRQEQIERCGTPPSVSTIRCLERWGEGEEATETTSFSSDTAFRCKGPTGVWDTI